MNDPQLDYFSPVAFIDTNTTPESQNSRRTMIKYLKYFDSINTVSTVNVTAFVRNLYFNGGINGKPVSRRYIENVLLTILPELRRSGKISNERLDLKRLWSNLGKEKTIKEKHVLRSMDDTEKFKMLNSNPDYFKLDTPAIVEILKDCDNVLLNSPAYNTTKVKCMATLLLAIGTGARIVSTIFKFKRPEIEKLFNDGHLVCVSKHVNHCDVYIVDSIRVKYRNFFLNNNFEYPISITKRILRYWYKQYIKTKFNKQLPPGKVMHEFRAWFIGHVSDTMGLRAAAKSVSHRNTQTTQAYINRSTYNIEMESTLNNAFKDIIV